MSWHDMVRSAPAVSLSERLAAHHRRQLTEAGATVEAVEYGDSAGTVRLTWESFCLVRGGRAADWVEERGTSVRRWACGLADRWSVIAHQHLGRVIHVARHGTSTVPREAWALQVDRPLSAMTHAEKGIWWLTAALAFEELGAVEDVACRREAVQALRIEVGA